MKNIKVNQKKIFFNLYIFAILIIRLFLATGVGTWTTTYNQYDDGMMIKNSTNLLAGKWLGTFDQYILAKGITFPAYLALIHKIGLPYLFANVLFCFAASLFFIIVIRKIVPNRFALASIYTVLMFNPVATACWTFQRVYRDSIYSYLVLLLFSCIIAIYLNRNSSVSKIILYSLGAGFFLSAVWLAREDSPWVMPFVALALIITAVSTFLKRNINIKQKIMKSLALTIVPFFLIISILTVSTINYKYYGIFMTNEYTGGYLPKLFKVLTIIKPDTWIANVPIPQSTREKAYEVSPTFAKLKPVLEKHPFVVNENYNASCSMLAWAVIDSVQWSGRKDAISSQEFYKKSYEEINAAIKSGKLQTRGGYLFMFESPWNNRYIKPLIKSLGETLRMTIHMSAYQDTPISSYNIISGGTKEQVEHVEYLTNWHGYYKGEKIPSKQNKIIVINDISKIYYFLNPFFFAIGLLCYIYIILRFIVGIRKKKFVLGDELLILTGLFLSYFLRLLLISYTDVCSTFMKYVMYLAPSYWLMLLATFVSIFVALNDIKNRRKNARA